MYIPRAFNVQDTEKIARFIEQNSFATFKTSSNHEQHVITQVGGCPFASHLPLLFDAPARRLIGHMARANPQWRHFVDDRNILVIFQGPHAYISPRWYRTELAVPTWNYAVVHVYGKPQMIADESQVVNIVKRTIRFYEGNRPDSWRGELPIAARARSESRGAYEAGRTGRMRSTC